VNTLIHRFPLAARYWYESEGLSQDFLIALLLLVSLLCMAAIVFLSIRLMEGRRWRSLILVLGLLALFIAFYLLQYRPWASHIAELPVESKEATFRLYGFCLLGTYLLLRGTWAICRSRDTGPTQARFREEGAQPDNGHGH